MERALHRWFGLAASLLLIVIATTGIGLQVERWINQPPEQPGPPPGGPRPLTVAAPGTLVDRAIVAARRARPDFVYAQIEVRDDARGGAVVLRANGPLGASLIYRGDGALTNGPRPIDPRWHELLQDIHAGYFAGAAGETVSLLAGMSLLLLGVTGLILHLRTWRRRWGIGRRSPFWK